jgi:hypothetical protein
MRLSTDIDIIVKPDTNIDLFIEKAARMFPFLSYKEDIRRSFSNLEKRHFKFYYDSHVTGRLFHILLDVVFEDNGYSCVIQKDIDSKFLITEPPVVQVTSPNINCILGDKLTAFAPHTIGIPFGVNKELEIIKQHFDIAVLIENMNDFTEVKDTYKRIAEIEIAHRELNNVSTCDTLADSFMTAITIIGRGNLYPEHFRYLADGMRKLKGHVLSSYSPVIAESQSCRIAYLLANLLANNCDYSPIEDASSYIDKSIINTKYAKMNFVKRTNLLDFAYLYEAIELFDQSI